MNLREDQKQLAMQLLSGVLLAALFLLIFYGPRHLPNLMVFGVPLRKIMDVISATLVILAFGVSLLMLYRGLARTMPVSAWRPLSAVLPTLCLLNTAGKNPMLIGIIGAAIVIDLCTAALVGLRTRQPGATQ